MRTVVKTEVGRLELNWMWLPTWIGMNSVLKKSLEKELSEKIVGMPMTDDSLDKVNQMVIDFLVEDNPHIEGLGDYLDGLKFVQFTNAQG